MALISTTFLGTVANQAAQAEPRVSVKQPRLVAPNGLSSPVATDPVPFGATKAGRLLEGSVNVVVSFDTRNSEQLQYLIDSKNTQDGGERRALTEQQFEAQYSPTQTDYGKVISFLTGNNITVTQTWPNRLMLAGRGTVTEVERAFNVEIDVYHYHGMNFYMNSREVQNPTLSGLGVAGIEINNLTMQPTMKIVNPALQWGINASNSSDQPDPVASQPSPSDLWNAYGTNNTIISGRNGSGDTIGIVDAFGDPTIISDVNSFDSYYGFPSFTPVVSGTGGSDPGWAIETALDVEWAHAMAPGATIMLQLSPDNLNTNLFGAVNTLVSLSNPPNAISLSWGGPESSGSVSYSSIFSAAVSKGIQVYVSTGDSGAYNGGSSLSVNYPAVDPNVIAVGGTTLYYNMVGSTKVFYEKAWNDSGGGYSTIFSEPAYQLSAGIPDPTGMRAIPDVALDANLSSGVRVYQGGSVYQVGGTSLSAPLMAGIDAVSLSVNSNFHLDNAHLYQVYASSYYGTSFHDITSGYNGYYSAGPRWDAVTGIGSINLTSYIGRHAPALNIRTRDWAGGILPVSTVNLTGSSGSWGRASDSNGWANFTDLLSGTYAVRVYWEGSKVNQTSITLVNSSVDLYVNSHVWDLTINAKDASGTPLQPNNMGIYVTFPNGTHVILSNVNSKSWKVQNGTYYFAVRWEGSWVYGNTSVPLDTATATQDLLSKVSSLSFNFRDNSGILSISPFCRIKAPNGTISTILSTVNQAQNGTWELVSFAWQGGNVVPAVHPTVSLAGADLTWTVNLRIYNINQYTFKDSSGSLTLSSIASFALKYPNGTLSVLTGNPSLYIQNGTTQLYSVYWQGNNIVPAANPSFDATNGNPSFNCRAYRLFFTFKDSSGTLTLSQVTTFALKYPNGTSSTLTSGSSLYIQNGTTELYGVSWQSSNIVPLTHPTFDATVGNQSFNCRVYKLSMTFKNAGGTATLYKNPTQITMLWSNGSSMVVQSYSNIEAQNGSYTVTSVTWNGMNVVPSPNPTISLTSDSILETKCLVYDLRIKVTDQFILPVVGAAVSITLSNGTTVNAITDNNGFAGYSQCPRGSFNGTITFLSQKVSIKGDVSQSYTFSIDTRAGMEQGIPMIAIVGGLAVAVVLIGISFAILNKRKSKHHYHPV